jgi:DNA-binding response OmpR family regulator
MDKKILLIEDDPVSRKFMELILIKEGFQVITSANGLEGLRKARSESPDLLILDVMLPGLDGFEVCYRLRSDTTTEKLPILILSAKGQESDKNSALQVGANAFLPKPVDRLVMLGKVSELLKSTVSSEPEKQCLSGSPNPV